MTDDDTGQRHFLTIRCLGCGKTVQLIGESRDDLLDRLASTMWKMVADASMSDPIEDSVRFQCPDCAVGD